MGESAVNFSAVSDMLEKISKTKKLPVKRKIFRSFLDHFYTDREYFSVMRLVLPELDRERGNYGLKESVLAKCLADALGLAKGSHDAEKLINWRKGGSQVGKNAGNFSLIAAEVVGSRQSRTSGGLKVKEVNDLLNQLVEAKSREDKSKVLAELINKTNAVEMKWIIMIILKDLKLGVSEKTIFKEFHPDADEVYNKTCDLKLVCEKLVDPKVRYKRQDIEVGKAVRPQLASRVKNAEEAWKKLRGKRIIAECKFDGDRCQVHKDGTSVNFFSRSSIDHKEFADAMSSVVCQNVLPSKCILDGEMVVWNRVTNRFAEFGTIQEVAKHARDGIQSDEQLCYIVFDILYVDDCSVIHQPLSERHKLLQQKVKPVSGRLEILLPDQRNCGGQLWSISAQSAGDIEQFFKVTVENRDEGIVVKDYDSKWEPGDRSGKWLKLKPDYVHPESDLDVLIIGGYFGSGRRGGDVAQFLLGLAERPASGYPTKFLSFCKVGSGLSDEECKILVDKLKPYFRRYDKNGKPPSYYVVTNNSKERPDVWIDQPDKSVILQIASDIRCIKSEVFASPYSLRFPRVHRVRYDKPWNECLDVQTLVEMVASGSGDVADATQRKQKQERTPKKKAPRLPLLAPHMQHTDVSGVKKLSDLFKGLVFFFANVSHEDKDRYHRLVAEYGGKFSMNLNSEVTHVIADNRKGLIYDTATKRGDVIHSSWFVDSIAKKELLPLRPKYMLHLSNKTKEKLKETFDEFGDHYFVDVDLDDVKQLFGYMQASELRVHEKQVLQLRSKYGTGSIFGACRIYFHHPTQPIEEEALMVADVALTRLEVEVRLHKGVVNESPRSATHMIVFWEAEDKEQVLDTLRFSSQERKLLCSKKLNILSHKWLEDALRRGSLPPEDDYSVKHLLQQSGMETGRELSPIEESPAEEDSYQKMDVDEQLLEEPARLTNTRKPEELRLTYTPEQTEFLSKGTADLEGRSPVLVEEEHPLIFSETKTQVPSTQVETPTIGQDTMSIDGTDQDTMLLTEKFPVELTAKLDTVIMDGPEAQTLKLPTERIKSSVVPRDNDVDSMMAAFFPGLSTIDKPVSKHQPRMQRTAETAGTNIEAKRKDEQADVSLPVKKKSKVSYKDRMGNIF